MSLNFPGPPLTVGQVFDDFLWDGEKWVRIADSGASSAAGDIIFAPAGDISGTNVQAALEELDNEKVDLDGDAMTGLLTLSGAPTANLHAATKKYVDDQIAAALAGMPTATGVSGGPIPYSSAHATEQGSGFDQITFAIGTLAFGQWYTQYSVFVDNVKAGDNFLVFAACENRNDSPWNVEFAQMLTATPGASVPDPLRVTEADGIRPGLSPNHAVSPVYGWGVGNSTIMHYGVGARTEWWKAPADYARVYFQLRVRFKSSSAVTGNEHFFTNMDLATTGSPQGGIKVFHWPNASSIRQASFDAIGTMAGRAAHDAKPSGFRYLVNDVVPNEMYERTTVTAGVWSGPVLVLPGISGQPCIDYVIDKTGTTNVDPGPGGLRFNAANANEATQLYLDELDRYGTNIAAYLDTFDDSNNTVKGVISIRQASYPEKLLEYSVTGPMSGTGYRALTVQPLVSSGANPFVNGDRVTLGFLRTGDRGIDGVGADITTKVSKSGDTMSGALRMSDLTEPTKGTILFGNTAGKYLHMDGTDLHFVGGAVRMASAFVQGVAVTPGDYLKLSTGGLVQGDVTVLKSAAPTTGQLFFGNSGNKSIFMDATYFQFLGITGGIIAPEGYKNVGGPWLGVSDARIKNVVGDYKSGLDAVTSLRPVIYTYKGNDAFFAGAAASPHKEAADGGKKYAGLIAQEIEKVMPELVLQRDGFIDGKPVADMRVLDTGPLIYALVNAIKELKERVEALEDAT